MRRSILERPGDLRCVQWELGVGSWTLGVECFLRIRDEPSSVEWLCPQEAGSADKSVRVTPPRRRQLRHYRSAAFQFQWPLRTMAGTPHEKHDCTLACLDLSDWPPAPWAP